MAIDPNLTQKNFLNKYRYLLPWVIVLLAVAARLLPGPRTIDDAYITFRYARHILAGLGFTFNPGEHVLGTTTPLYTLLMVGLGSLTGGADAPFPVLAWLLNAAADAASCYFLWKIGSRLGSRMAGFATALVWAVASYSVTFAVGGMETSIYVLLLVSSVYTYLIGRYKTWALLSGLAFLTRPDALILIGLLALDRLFRSLPKPGWRSLFSELGVFLLTVLPWVIFAVLYFGSPLPNSIAAKTLAYRLPPEAGLIRLIQHYAVPFQEDSTFGVPAIAVGLVLYPFLYLVGLRRAWRSDRRSWAFLVYPWAYFAIYAIANPLLFRWYLTPPLPAYLFAILFGADHLLASLFKKRSRADSPSGSSPRLVWVTALLVVFVPFFFLLRAWEIHPDHGINRPAPGMAWYKLELIYQQVSDLVVPSIRPGDTLAAGDVGVLGYYSSARILDTVGLNSPQSIHYYPLDPSSYVINYAIPAELILDYHPRFVVFLEVYGRETLLKNPEFLKTYSLWQKIPTDIYESDGMLVYRRLTDA